MNYYNIINYRISKDSDSAYEEEVRSPDSLLIFLCSFLLNI